MSVYNLDMTLRRLHEEKGWCTKKECRFVKWLDSKDLIEKGQKPGRREVESLDKLIIEFENRDKD